MKVGPKYKLAKRLGPTVFEKTQSQKFALAQERAGLKRRGRGRGPSEYGKQLLEKQKVRITYGLTEKQFSSYVKKAMQTHGRMPIEVLNELIEMRLDNVMYRLGVAPTRRAARQMVSHGHVTVNGIKTTIPSRAMRVGDSIGIRAGSQTSAMFENHAETFKERQLPSWLSWDPKGMKGEVKEIPAFDNALTAGDLHTVLSFYSR